MLGDEDLERLGDEIELPPDDLDRVLKLGVDRVLLRCLVFGAMFDLL